MIVVHTTVRVRDATLALTHTHADRKQEIVCGLTLNENL